MPNQALQKDAHGQQNDIFKVLEDLKVSTQRILERNDLTLEESKLLCDSIAHLRMVLNAWEKVQPKNTGQNAGLRTAIRDMSERFLELEGIVKEARNDLMVNG